MNLCISCLNATESTAVGTMDGQTGIFCEDCSYWLDGNLLPEERERLQAVAAIAESSWSTRELVSFVRNWSDQPDWRKPVWSYVALSEDAAMALLDSYEAEQEVRDICANALVLAGWTLRSINYKKS